MPLNIDRKNIKAMLEQALSDHMQIDIYTDIRQGFVLQGVPEGVGDDFVAMPRPNAPKNPYVIPFSAILMLETPGE